MNRYGKAGANADISGDEPSAYRYSNVSQNIDDPAQKN